MPADVRRLVASTVLLVAGLVLVFAVLPLDGEHRRIGIVTGTVLVLAFVPVLVIRSRSILVSTRPVAEATAAAVVTFAFFTIVSAMVYYAVASADDGAFSGLVTKIDALYFTIVVATTVGFGDITPLSQTARLLTTMQLLGTLAFLGGAIRIFGWAARRRLAEKQSDEPER